MDLKALLRKFCSPKESEATIATLSLEVAQAHLSPSAKVFLNDHVLRHLDSKEDSIGGRETLTFLSERIDRYIATELHPRLKASSWSPAMESGIPSNSAPRSGISSTSVDGPTPLRFLSRDPVALRLRPDL